MTVNKINVNIFVPVCQTSNLKVGAYKVNFSIIKSTSALMFWIVVAFILGLSSVNYALAAITIALSICLIAGWLRNCFDKKFFLKLFLLSLFSVSYFLISYLYDQTSLIRLLTHPFFIICAYIAGRTINIPTLRGHVYGIIPILLSMIAGFVIYSALSVNTSLSDMPTAILITREVQNYWDANDYLPATYFSLACSLGLTLLPTLLYIGSIKIKIYYLVSFGFIIFFLILIALYSSIILQNRSPYLSLLLAFVISIYIGRKHLIYALSHRMFWAIFLLIFAVAVALFTDIYISIYDFLHDIILIRFQSEGLDSARYTSWRYMIGELLNNPLGGRAAYIGGERYVHNLWLDVAYSVGIIPMCLLILFHISQISNFILIVKSKLPLFIIILFACIAMSFFVSFVGDPTMDAGTLFFAASCFFLGIVNSVAYNIKYYEEYTSRL